MIDSGIKQALTGLIRDVLQWEGEIPDGELSNYLDSIKRLSLVVDIEDHWEICFEPEDEEAILTLDDLALRVEAILERERKT